MHSLKVQVEERIVADDSGTKKTEWRPISELKLIDKDISSFGYPIDFIKANKLHRKKSPHVSRSTGQISFYELLEVRERNGQVYFRENNNYERLEKPKKFETQFGAFNNHNRGEFFSWLGKDDYKGLPEEERKLRERFGQGDLFIEGNYCDMFDCGEYVYAISNSMHMRLGSFKIVRIDKYLNTAVMFDTSSGTIITSLKYLYHCQVGNGHIIIASGSEESNRGLSGERKYHDITFVFYIDIDGQCDISHEWDFRISSSNSEVKVGDYVYFGQNKMITRLDINTGELKYFTNKNDEELAALASMW